MKVNVVFRAVAGDNGKPRPPWFSKHLTLLSCLRAWESCAHRGEFVLLAGDGVPAQTLDAVRAAGGSVEALPGPTAQSIARALELQFERGWPEEDLVQHVEDDYLFRPEALDAVVEAARERPDVDYFALYGTIREQQPNGEPLPPVCRRPPERDAVAPLELGEVRWRQGIGHCATVAVRMRAARRDRRLQWVAPRAGPWWDHSVCLAYQGRFPFRLFPREALVTETLTTARTRGLAPALRVTGRRLEMCGHAAAHRRSPHRLLVAWPALITHGELGYLATGTDWDVVAAGTEAWARERF